jgi:hypothetical protein
MTIDWHLVAQITVPIVTLLGGAFLERIIERRAKVVVFYGHVASHTLGQTQTSGAIPLNTHSIIIRNTGRLAARNLRVRHGYLPPNFRIDPPRSWTRNSIPNGGDEILFEELVPNETISISYLYFPPLTFDQILTRVSSDEGYAIVQNVVPTVQPSRVMRIWRTAMQTIGIIASVYLMVEFVRFLLMRLSQ